MLVMERTMWTDARLDERFDRIDKRFDDIDRRLDRIEAAIVDLRRDMFHAMVVLGAGYLALAAGVIAAVVARG
jgi:hypothetical protein